MAPTPVDTSMTGYVSASVDNQDDIYRNRQRPQPRPFVQYDSGYGSDTKAPFGSLQTQSSTSLLSLANAVKRNELLDNESNFALKTTVECYENDKFSTKRRCLDDKGLEQCLLPPVVANSDGENKHRVVLLFSTLEFAQNASYKARSSFSKASVEALMSCWDLHDLFIPDLLGRPNYWCPELYSTPNGSDMHGIVEYFCQYPRFTIHGPKFVQRSPVSVYMRHDAEKNLTYYIVSAPNSEECVKSFQNLLNIVCKESMENNSSHPLFQHPLEAHILLSKILCESSQGYINAFRQSMFAQLRAVDELSSQETANRKGLADVTIELQIISKDVNKLISDIDVESRNLTKMEEAFTRLNRKSSIVRCVPPSYRQQLQDTLQYLISSMDKQKMWLHNYRDRKDIAMSLVFNLVTQQDAANNFRIAKDMRRDSSSMNGIALLTMVFLPGTFTSTVLGAGLYSAVAETRSIHISGLWWFWAAITFPLTGVVLFLWGMFCWRHEIQIMLRNMMTWRKTKGNDDDVEAKI